METLTDTSFCLDDSGWYEPSHFEPGHEPFNPWDESPDPSAVIGDPVGDADLWSEQQGEFTCAVVSQKMILESFGVEVSESQLVYEATSNGWFTDTGTPLEDMAKLLDLHGVDTHPGYGGMDGIIDELRQGHKIVVALDSGEIMGSDSVGEDFFEGKLPDHAVQVTGLDMSNPDAPMVVLNDPGHPEGAGVEVPLEKFVDAWDDSDFRYFATDDAPPNLSEHHTLGANFNQAEDGSGQYMDDGFWDVFSQKMGWIVSNTAEAAVGGVIGAVAGTGIGGPVGGLVGGVAGALGLAALI